MEYLFGPQHRAVMGRGWSSAFCICLQKIKCFIMKKNIVFYYCSVKCILHTVAVLKVEERNRDKLENIREPEQRLLKGQDHEFEKVK